MDCSPPGFSVHGILQARILEWIAIPFSRGSSQPRDQTQVSHITGRFFTIWAREAHQGGPQSIFYLFIYFFPKHILDNIFTSLLWLSPCSQIYTILLLKIRRRQWHPTPVLLPGKSHGGGVWWAAVHGVVKSRTWLSDFTFTFHFHALEKEMATHSSILAWRIPGMGELAGCRVWGCTESDTTEVT